VGPSVITAPRSLSGSGSSKSVWLVIAGAIVVGVQAWTVYRVTRVGSEVAESNAYLEDTRGSLGMLWTTTTRLDKDQVARHSTLRDSINSVFAYAQGESRLWQTAFDEHQQRLEEYAASLQKHSESITRIMNAASAMTARLDGVTRSIQVQLTRLEGLERQDRAQAGRIAALASQGETHSSVLLGVSETMTALRQTLSGVDTELTALENRIAASQSAQGQLVQFADGFRRAGLNGSSVETRLITLADGLRRVTARLDSLRSGRIADRNASSRN
jgi:chromosome segregation ATPase